MGLEYFDQTLVFAPVVFQAFQFVATGAKSTGGRMAQCPDCFSGFCTGIDQIFGQCSDDAVTPGVNFPDFVGMCSCRFQ